MNTAPLLRPFIALALLIVCTGTPLHAATVQTLMPDLVREFEADHASIESFYKLPWEEASFDRSEKVAGDWLARLRQVDFDALDQEGRADYVLIRHELENEQADIARDRKRLAEMENLLAFRTNVYALEYSRLREGRLDGPASASKVSEIASLAKKLKEQVERGKNSKPDGDKDPKKDDAKKTNEPPAIAVSPALALRASEAVGRLRETLKSWFGYYDGFNPEASWWLKQPYDDADKALDDYGKFLREEIAGQKGKDEDPLVGDPLGADAVASDMASEFIPYSAGDLIALGERELAWGEAEMKKAARETGCGDDWHAALAKVKADFVAPGEQDELVAKTGRDAIEFVKKHQFATIPPLCEETWQLTMMSPETMKQIPYAAYNNQHMMVAFANQSMKQEDKLMVMRGNNRSFTHLTTAHELIPGHHLQLFYAARHNTHRQMFGTPFYIEGWAFYCELRLWELGWARTPQERIGMLFWRMNRAARTIVSLKFHLGKMTPDEMVEFMMGRVGHEKFGATSECRRIVRATPLYQTAYLLGGRQFHALHDELVGSGKRTEQKFHDAVLSENTMPVEILRALMENLPLTRDYKSAWKFAGDHPGAAAVR